MLIKNSGIERIPFWEIEQTGIYRGNVQRDLI